MSASAGRVMLMPKGEYSATTQYEILDLVTYQGVGYIAKQRTKGNLPTNTTYWQPNGNAGGSGVSEFANLDDVEFSNLEDGQIPVYNAETHKWENADGGGSGDYMLKDGSNADGPIDFQDDNQSYTLQHVNITKAAGDNQTVYLEVHVKWNSTTGKLFWLIRSFIDANFGNENVYFYDDSIYHTKTYIIMDEFSGSSSISYDTNDDVFTVAAHLKVDSSDAINSTDKSISIEGFISDDVARGIALGYGNALSGNLGYVGGRNSAVISTFGFAHGQECAAGTNGHAVGKQTHAGISAHAEGQYTDANATGSHAEGTGTIATYNNQHAQGKWNYPRYGAAFMIGNGTPAERSNCFEIYEDGGISTDNGATKFKFGKSGDKDGYVNASGTFIPFNKETTLTKNNITLSTSDVVTVTFTNDAILTTSWIEVGTNIYGIVAKDVRTTAGRCEVDFAPVDNVITVNVQLKIR